MTIVVPYGAAGSVLGWRLFAVTASDPWRLLECGSGGQCGVIFRRARIESAWACVLGVDPRPVDPCGRGGLFAAAGLACNEYPIDGAKICHSRASQCNATADGQPLAHRGAKDHAQRRPARRLRAASAGVAAAAVCSLERTALQVVRDRAQRDALPGPEHGPAIEAMARKAELVDEAVAGLRPGHRERLGPIMDRDFDLRRWVYDCPSARCG